MKRGALQGSILALLLFLLYIHDITKITNTKDNDNKSQLPLFADDTSLIITISDPTNFIHYINEIFSNINNWFKANFLSLNFEKTNFIQFLTKNSSQIPFSVSFNNNIKSNTNIKFLRILTDNTLTWKSHTAMIRSNLSTAYFVVRAIKPFVMQVILKVVYHSCFHLFLLMG